MALESLTWLDIGVGLKVGYRRVQHDVLIEQSMGVCVGIRNALTYIAWSLFTRWKEG